MKKKPIYFLSLLAITFFLSGCSLGFLAGKKQAVKIEKDSLTTILINDSVPITKKDKYILELNGNAVNLTFKKQGYKDEHRAILQYKKSALYYGTYALNMGIIGGSSIIFSYSASGGEFIPSFSIAGMAVGAGFGWLGSIASSKLRLFDNNISYDLQMQKVQKRDSTMKQLYLNKVSFNVPDNSIKKMSMSDLKAYYKGEIPNKWINDKKGLKIENSIFSDEINNILKKNGFIDTSGLVLKESYKQNLYINISINEMKLLNVSKGLISGDFTKLFLNTKWELLDIYKNVIFADTLNINSGEFSIIDYSNENVKLLISDALESGLYAFMNTEKFKSEIKVSEKESIESLKEIAIPNSSKYVSKLEDAVNATITVKNKTGHGSGFIISENGYIITNYHVVSDTAKLEVVLNDGTTQKATMIQFNKDKDLALLKIEKNGLIAFFVPEIEMINIGKEIYVIGTPSAQDLSQTLTRGIISSIRRQVDGSKLIQTDASVNRGNSGGSLVDKNGQLIGVVNAKLIGIGIEGISFAIPASQITQSLKIVFK